MRNSKNSSHGEILSLLPDNITEGHISYYYQDKIKGFNTARKEAGETQNHIRALQDKKYITAKVVRDIISRYKEVIHGINGYVRWVREKRISKK
jgi:four helix bundle protein